MPGSRRNRDNHRAVRIDAQTELLATRPEVWALLAEPQHLADWWPAYASIRPDRRGLVEGARWEVARGGSIGLLRRPESEGIIVITAVEPERRLAWHDVQQRFTAELLLEPAADGMTRATLTIDSPGARRNPRGPAPAAPPGARPTARPLPDCCNSVDAHVRPPLPRCIPRCRLRRARDRHPRRRRHERQSRRRREAGPEERRQPPRARSSTPRARAAPRVSREQTALRAFIKNAYPKLIADRLHGKRVAVLFVGPVDAGRHAGDRAGGLGRGRARADAAPRAQGSDRPDELRRAPRRRPGPVQDGGARRPRRASSPTSS